MSEPSKHAREAAHSVNPLIGERKAALDNIQDAIDAVTAELIVALDIQDAIDAATAELIVERDALKTRLAESQAHQSNYARFQEATLMSEKGRADRAEAACAEKNKLLRDIADDPGGIKFHKRIVEVLSDAGRGWVPVEDVRPLLAASYGSKVLWELQKAFLAKHGDKLK